MINLYAANEVDFSTNGILALDKYCVSATISEELNGSYELEMELTNADNTYTNQVKADMVLKAPAPVREEVRLEGLSTVKVYKASARLYMYNKPRTSARRLRRVKKNATLFWVEDAAVDGWYRMTTKSGKSGYVRASQVTLSSETASGTGEAVITPEMAKEQLFRIYEVSHTLDGVQVKARHIFYDLVSNYVKNLSMPATSGAAALSNLLAACMEEHEFEAYSDVTRKADIDASRKNPIETLMGEEGFGQYKAELLRDNYNIYLLNHIGRNRGMSIAYRKNMTGLTVDVDVSNVVTRIIPIGADKKGKEVYLDPPYVDSAHINDYSAPRIVERAYSDVKVGKDYKTLADVRAELLKRAQQELADGVDMPKVSVDVDFVDLDDATRELRSVYLGDEVRIKHEEYGFDLSVNVIGYTWDCLLGEYESLSLGDAAVSMSGLRINPELIPSSRLTGRMLAPAAVDASAMEDGAVSEDALQDQAVGPTKIADGAVGNVHIQDASIDSAKIKDLEAEVATIADARIGSATIGTAQISDLSAVVASLAQAEIGSADIDWAHIKDLVTDTAIITQGVGGKLYINRLAVTEANMVSLTVGELLVKGADGKFYALGVDGDGNVTTTERPVGADNIADDTIPAGKIIESSITARELNVAEIFADSALVGAIKAANIEADAIQGQHLSTNAITALNGRLDLTANDSINAIVGAIQIGGRNLIKSSKTLDGMAGASADYGTYIIDGDDGFKVFECEPVDTAQWRGLHIISTLLPLAEAFGKTFTFSCLVRSDDWAAIQSATSGEPIYLTMAGCADGSVTRTRYRNLFSSGSEGRALFVSAKWVKFLYTFTVGDDVSWLNLGSGTATHFYLQVYNHSTFGTQIMQPKLEYGTKATDWSPSPQDADDRIDGAYSQISQASDKISMVVADGSTSSSVIIQPNALSAIARDINLTANDSINAVVGGIQVGGTNILRDTRGLTVGSGAEYWRVGSGTNVSISTDGNGIRRIHLSASGLTSDAWYGAPSPLTKLPADWIGRTVVLSAWVYSADWAAVDQGISWEIDLSQGGTTRLNYITNYSIIKPGEVTLGSQGHSDGMLSNAKWVRVWTTFTLTPDNAAGAGTFASNTHIFVTPRLKRNGDYWIRYPKLEFGTKPTDWSPSPDEMISAALSIDPVNGLKVTQSALGTYFQANADKFGLYNSSDNKAFAEVGVSGDKGYLAVNRLGTPDKSVAFKADLGTFTDADGTWHGMVLSDWSDNPIGSIYGHGAPGYDEAILLIRGGDATSYGRVSICGSHVRIYATGGDTNADPGFQVAGWSEYDGRLIPAQTATYRLGSEAKRWGTLMTSNSPNISSDLRLKQDIAPIDRPEALIYALEPVRFRLKSDPDAKPSWGFIAQQVADALSSTQQESAVVDDSYPDSWGLVYEQLIAPLVATVQTQHRQIDALEQRLARLEQLLGVQQPE